MLSGNTPQPGYTLGSAKPWSGTGQYAHLTVTNPQLWTTTKGQCEPGEDCCLSLLCFPCAWGMARAALDGSDCWFHTICTTWLHVNHMTRHYYDITGDNGEECISGLFCPFCSTRQALVETRLRQQKIFVGRSVAPGSRAGGRWKADLCSCTPEMACYVCCCPLLASARTQSMYDGTNVWMNMCTSTPCHMVNTVRHGYGLDGDPVMDILTTVLLYPCSISRAGHEVVARAVERAMEKARAKVQGCCGCCGGSSQVAPAGQQGGMR
eukprot:PhM_4_TR2986/c0_g1_i1/m.1119